jgi:hypothetical protein
MTKAMCQGAAGAVDGSLRVRTHPDSARPIQTFSLGGFHEVMGSGPGSAPAPPCKTVTASFLSLSGHDSGDRKHLDLKKRAGDKQLRHFHGCDGRWSLKVRRPHLAVLRKLAHIGEVGTDIYHVGKRCAVCG